MDVERNMFGGPAADSGRRVVPIDQELLRRSGPHAAGIASSAADSSALTDQLLSKIDALERRQEISDQVSRQRGITELTAASAQRRRVWPAVAVAAVVFGAGGLFAGIYIAQENFEDENACLFNPDAPTAPVTPSAPPVNPSTQEAPPVATTPAPVVTAPPYAVMGGAGGVEQQIMPGGEQLNVSGTEPVLHEDETGGFVISEKDYFAWEIRDQDPAGDIYTIELRQPSEIEGQYVNDSALQSRFGDGREYTDREVEAFLQENKIIPSEIVVNYTLIGQTGTELYRSVAYPFGTRPEDSVSNG